MAEDEPQETEQEAAEQEGEQEDEQKAGGGQKIMCFVSKKMVPINETEEVEYKPGKKVRVMPEYIKFDREEEEASA